MNETRKKTRFMMMLSMVACIQLVLMNIPMLGFIPLGPVNATTVHIPVIVGGILLGWKAGAVLGAIFGLTSMIRATVMPGVTAFWFSPFVTIGPYSGNVMSGVIALAPRILLGMAAAGIYHFLKNKNLKLSAAAISALTATLIHTFSVLGLVYLVFGSQSESALGLGPGGMLTFLMGIVTTNGIVEALLAGVLVTAIVKACEPVVRRALPPVKRQSFLAETMSETAKA